jgi:hypothetical protein
LGTPELAGGRGVLVRPQGFESPPMTAAFWRLFAMLVSILFVLFDMDITVYALSRRTSLDLRNCLRQPKTRAAQTAFLNCKTALLVCFRLSFLYY